MGIYLCRNLQTSIKNRCSKCRILQGTKIFVSFQGCQHKFCKKCLSIGDNCPFQQKKNSLIQKGIELLQNYRENDEQLKVFCPKNHQMIWKSEEHICRKCLRQGHGFTCKQCKSNTCTFCVKNYSFTKDFMCPNNHLCEWLNDSQICMWCLKKQNGWRCKKCNFVICSQCTQTIYQKCQCPNGDGLIWTKEKNRCVKCKINYHGWKCVKCIYHLCTVCSDTNFQQLKCPNGHNTKFKSLDVCIRCNIESKVMNCSKCNFNYCTKCELFKYSTNKLSAATVASDRDYQTRKPEIHFNNLLFKSKFQSKSSKVQKIQQKQSQKQQQDINTEEYVQKLREEAKRYSLLKNYTKQIELYKNCTQLEPNKINNWFDLAQAYLKNNLKQQAIETYSHVAKTMDNIQSLLRINKIIVEDKDNKIENIKAARMDILKCNCKKILQKNECNIQTNLLYGRIHSFQNIIQQSLKYIQKAQFEHSIIYKQQKNDKNYNVLIQILKQKVHNLRLKKDYAKALKQLDKIIYITKQNNKPSETWENIKQQIQKKIKRTAQLKNYDTVIYDPNVN